MSIIYSHRGNLLGPAPGRENKPSYVDDAIAAGFHVEVDLHYFDGALYLGHDFPQYRVDHKWLDARKDRLLFHLKNLSTVYIIKGYQLNWHYFCHSRDPWVMTSMGYVWLHDLSQLGEGKSFSIIPLISRELVTDCQHTDLHGVCSNFARLAAEKFK